MAHPIGALLAYSEFQLRHDSSESLNGSYHMVGTVALFLLDCSGLLPMMMIPGHVIGILCLI